jgi:hypothetical protein
MYEAQKSFTLASPDLQTKSVFGIAVAVVVVV